MIIQVDQVVEQSHFSQSSSGHQSTLWFCDGCIQLSDVYLDRPSHRGQDCVKRLFQIHQTVQM